MTSQTLIPTLHHLTSSQSQKVLFMLEELAAAKDIKYNLEIHARNTNGNPGLVKEFPVGKSPILVVYENGVPAKDVYQLPNHPGILTESRLILAWLAETYGEGLYTPESKEERCQDVFLQEFANYTLSVKTTLALVPEAMVSFLPFGIRHVFQGIIYPVVQYWKNDMVACFQLMEDLLTDEKPFFSGKKIGLADFNMVWPMSVADQRGYYDKKKFPKVTAWFDNIKERPGWKSSIDKGGYYNLKTFVDN